MLTKSARGSAASRSAHRLAAGGLDFGGGLVGVVDQDVHFHREAALGGARADAAEAYDQHGLAEEVVGQHAEPAGPFAVLDDGMHFDGALGQRQHHEQRLFGNRRRIRGARDHQRDLAAAQRGNVDGVETDADPGHHLHVAGRLQLRFAEPGGAERHAMDRRVLPELGLEIACGNHVREFDEVEVVPCLQQSSSGLRNDSVMKIFFLLVVILAPLLRFLLCGRHRTAPVASFSRCILLRSTANRSGAPSRARHWD